MHSPRTAAPRRSFTIDSETARLHRRFNYPMDLSFPFRSGYFYSVILYILITSDKSIITIVLVQILNLLFAIVANLLPCLLIRTHPRMWHVAKKHIFRCTKVALFGRVQEPRIVADQNIAVNEANVYFQQLHASWK
uniref:G protein-coupled receptor n=1 Tax=Steinernema glaseri TaxID=37863 RepID=A0A1I7YXW1_9BILA